MRELVITYNKPIYDAECACAHKMTQMSLDYCAANGRKELLPVEMAAIHIAYKFVFAAHRILCFMKRITAKHEIQQSD